MTIERAPGTNGHRGHEGAEKGTPLLYAGDERRPPAIPDTQRGEAGSGRTAHRRVPLDVRGLVASAAVAVGVVLILRRIDRGASR